MKYRAAHDGRSGRTCAYRATAKPARAMMPAMALLAKAVAMAAGLEVEEAPLVEGEPLELPPVGEGEELPVLVTPVWVCLVTVELPEPVDEDDTVSVVVDATLPVCVSVSVSVAVVLAVVVSETDPDPDPDPVPEPVGAERLPVGVMMLSVMEGSPSRVVGWAGMEKRPVFWRTSMLAAAARPARRARGTTGNIMVAVC